MSNWQHPEWRVASVPAGVDPKSVSGFYVRAADAEAARAAYLKLNRYAKGERIRVERWKEPYK